MTDFDRDTSRASRRKLLQAGAAAAALGAIPGPLHRAAQMNDAAWRTLRPPLFALNEGDRARLFAALAAAGFPLATETEQ